MDDLFVLFDLEKKVGKKIDIIQLWISNVSETAVTGVTTAAGPFKYLTDRRWKKQYGSTTYVS